VVKKLNIEHYYEVIAKINQELTKNLPSWQAIPNQFGKNTESSWRKNKMQKTASEKLLNSTRKVLRSIPSKSNQEQSLRSKLGFFNSGALPCNNQSNRILDLHLNAPSIGTGMRIRTPLLKKIPSSTSHLSPLFMGVQMLQ
jgi:hypothetical protein